MLTDSAKYFVPNSSEIDIREAAKSCRGCPLYKDATQVVFGEGKPNAQLMLIGEQPGDQEDLAGRPFVGPAGKVLREALDKAGIIEDLTYITNAVKHFKWKQMGARRLHQKPSTRERMACLPWLEAEIIAIRPKALVCLGATASQSVFGQDFRLSEHRGKIVGSRFELPAIATLHPSAILRMRDQTARALAKEELVKDLVSIQSKLLELANVLPVK